jgi:hypothetical protein
MSGGGGEAGGSGGEPAELCGGCLAISVPLTQGPDGGGAAIDFYPLADLSESVLTARVQLVAGVTGGFQMYVQNNNTNDFKGDYHQYLYFETLSPGTGEWKTVTLDVSAREGDPEYEPENTSKLSVTLHGWGTGEDWVNPSVLYLDEITDSSGAIGPYTFDSATSPETEAFHGDGTIESVTWIP